MSEKIPILVVVGIDVDGKPHASRFEERDAAFVQRAAELMGFQVVRVPPGNPMHAIAGGLPLGKIFASGRAFVPFVGRLIFDKLAALAQTGGTNEAPAAVVVAPAQPVAAMFTNEAATAADALWSKIEVGTVVLAAQPDLYGPGWWQVVVVGVDGDDLTLRWVDDPAEEPFRLTRRDVGLLHPGAE
jgi:hypothetical protein